MKQISKLKQLLYMVALVLILLTVTGCTSGSTDTLGSSPYIGGTEALQLSFVQGSPPDEIYDDEQFSFAITLQIENVGESDLESNDGYVEISGIAPEEYGVSKSSLTEDIPAIDGARKNGDFITNGNQDFMTFEGLEYQQNIAGDLDSTVIRATACYDYTTKTSTSICVKEDLNDNANENSICTVQEDKTVANSGGPIHITSLATNPQGRDKLQVLFEISAQGNANDRFFKLGTECDQKVNNPDKYKVFVDVGSVVNGKINAQCTGFQEGSGSSGYITLPSGQPRQMSCSFDVSSVDSDFETPLNIDLKYRYMEFIEKPILIKDISTNE